MKQKTGRKLLGVLLTLAMVVGLVPGMGLTAYAATSHGITINTAQHGTVTASVNGSAATSAEEGATVTLTANPDNGYRLKSISGTYKGNPQETKGLNGTKTINGTYFNLSATDAAGAGWSLKNNSTITITSKDSSVKIDKLDFNIQYKGNSFNLNNVSCSAGTKSLNGNTLSVSSINGTTVTLSSSVSNVGYVRFNSVTIYGTGAVDTNLTISTTGDVNVRTFTMPTVVQGDVTITPVFEEIPKYNVTLNGGANAITSGGNTTQTGVTGAMTTVTYTANSGYHFTEFANITNNGITATRTSDTVVAVSGTPTADASITIPDAVADAVAVTGVTLNPSAAQTIDVDGTVSFTATVLPDNATDKSVKWSVGGTDTGAVKLYSDEACTTEVGADATDKLTVYAKGISAGSATITATSNADSEKKASCDVTVNAAQTQTEELLTTITAVGASKASTATSANVSYSTEDIATLTFSQVTPDGYGRVSYVPTWGWWGYGITLTVTPADGYTITKCVFYDDANRTATDSEAPFVVETAEEGDKAPKVNGTPILAYTSKGIKKIEVYGYATPTATHSVTITPGDNMTKTAGSGDAEQTGLTGAMTDVVYTANEGYYFPTDYSVTTVNGISVTRNSYTQITVSGTPTADAAITLTAPTAKTTPDAPTAAAATDCTTADNSDGKLTGVTTAMEYKKSDAADWTAGTGSDITGLVPGTYYVRIKATDTTLASDNQELTVNAAQTQMETLLTTVTPTGKSTYSETTAGVVTVTFDPYTYNSTYGWLWFESGSVSVAANEGYTITKCVFRQNAKDPITVSAAPFAIHFEYGMVKEKNRYSDMDGITSIEVYGYASKAAQTITAEDVTVTYGDTDKSVSATVTEPTTGGGEISYAVKTGSEDYIDVASDGKLTIKKVPSDGKAYVTVTAAATDDYAQATKEVTVTINTKAMTFSAENVNVTVDGQPHGITVNVTDPASGATVKYGTEEGSYTLDASPTQTEVGTKTVYYQVTADNYTTYTGSATVTVNAKQTQTITASDVTATYGDTGKSVSGTTSGDGAISYSVKSGDAVTVNPTTGALTIVKAGSAVITVTAAETATYAQATKDVNVTVNTKAMTVSAENVNVTVDGQPHGITVNVTDPASGATVKYGTEEGSYTLDASPTQTEVGEKTVYYQVTADNYTTYTGSAKVTVNAKQTQTITASDVTATYGDTDKSVSGTTTGDGAISYSVKSGDAVTVDSTTGALTILKAGSAVITVTAAETATYAQATKDVNVTVNTKAMTVSAENVNVTVDGQPHGITVNVTDPASGATVKYGTEEGSYTLDASPTQTEAGELTVYYQVTADNYTTYTGSAKVTVSDKSTQTIDASDVTATYGDTDKKVEATTDGNGAISYAVKEGSSDYIDVDSTTGALTIKKVGTATVIVTAAETATYAQATKEVTVTINKANAVAASVTANNRTYDGTEKPLVTVTGEPTGGEMQYALGTAGGATQPYTTSIPSKTDAGTYYVWYRVKGDSNHNDVAAASVTVTINKKLLTITAGAKSKVYGEKDPELTYDSTGLVEGDNITGSLTRDAGENAGTYAITQGTVTASDNYELSYVPALLTITKADSNTTAPTANELNYSGSAQELVTAGTPTGGTLVYSTDGESYNEMIPTGINAGEYTVYYKVIGDANHNDKVVQQVTVTILARTLDIKADEKSKTYGEDDPALTYTSEGLVEGDSITGALSRAEGENVGTYAIEQGTLTAGDNYIITYTGANLAITEAASSVTTEPVTKMPTYNGGKQTLVAGGEVAGGTMQYALGTDAEIAPTEGWSTSIPAETDAGTYYVWYRAVGDNNHSDVEATCVSVDIEKAAITITADDKSSQKGAELQELSWQVSGDYVSGDELGISASTTADSSADAGVYPITVSWNDNANYEATLISGKYTITAPEESGRVETKTIVADNVPSCSISNLTTELARSLATEEELIRVQNGENLLIYLDMENIDDSVSATDKSLVEAAVKASSKDAKVGMYLDLTLYKKVGDGAATKVTDTKESRISVTIEVPDSLKGGSDVTRTFYIIRVHDGATDILATTTETTITFETDKFSTYALAYSDKSNGSPSVTTPAQQEKAPKTGDNFPSVWLWALILAGGLVPVGYAGGRHKGLERK